ncbi:MAG: flavodoxin family protein [Treponema sp.]|nr:flavodoxin family protein [Treponema sp.]
MNALVINCSPVKNGATAEIVKIICSNLEKKYAVKNICIDDYKYDFCKGCRSCHATAKCIIQNDDIQKIISEFEKAEIIICVSPSYWADVPGQFKSFIDRCTPWCNTHEPHAKLSGEKKGYSVALRTGPNMKECERIIGTIEHFYGHMEIKSAAHLGLCSIENKNDLLPKVEEINIFCKQI